MARGKTLTQKPTRPNNGPLEILKQNTETLLIAPFAIFLIVNGGSERDPVHNLTKPGMSYNSKCCPAKISVAGVYGLLFVVIFNHLFDLR